MSINLFKRDDAHEFQPILAEIEDSPVNPMGRTILWIVFGVILFFGLWMFFGQIDIVVPARGIVIPNGQNKIIQPLDSGVIRAIRVKEGDYVRRGQVLVEIDPAMTAPALESTDEKLRLSQMEMKRLQAAATGSSYSGEGSQTQKELYYSSVDSLQKQIEAKEEALKKADAEIASTRADKAHYEELLSKSEAKEQRLKAVLDIIARDDYEKTVNDILTYRNNILESKYRLEELAHEKAGIEKEIAYLEQNFKVTNLQELSQHEKEQAELEAQAREITFKHTKQQIVSPVDGYVDSLFIHTVGGVVTPAQKLLSIVPVDMPLMIKATVLNKDVGFVKKDMPVAIKIDTFDFQKYGMLQGRVQQISKDSHPDPKQGPVYKVYVTPIDQYLMVDGHKQFLTSGMSLTAEVKVGKRRIIEFFIYPLIKYLNEGMSVR